MPHPVDNSSGTFMQSRLPADATSITGLISLSRLHISSSSYIEVKGRKFHHG